MSSEAKVSLDLEDRPRKKPNLYKQISQIKGGEKLQTVHIQYVVWIKYCEKYQLFVIILRSQLFYLIFFLFFYLPCGHVSICPHHGQTYRSFSHCAYKNPTFSQPLVEVRFTRVIQKRG